jgi:hypothetical protein
VYLIREDGTLVDAAGDNASFSMLRYFPGPNDASSICLRFVDPYGDIPHTDQMRFGLNRAFENQSRLGSSESQGVR